MSEDEVYNSADCFPIEFHDMKERRRVLYGLDVIADLKFDMRNYRTQVEHELRSKLLRLRQQGALSCRIRTGCWRCAWIRCPPSACWDATLWNWPEEARNPSGGRWSGSWPKCCRPT